MAVLVGVRRPHCAFDYISLMIGNIELLYIKLLASFSFLEKCLLVLGLFFFRIYLFM